MLRALTESGAIWDDPSEDLLFELLSDIDRGHGTWFIVERVADATGQTYIQVIQDGQGGWTVERREGGLLPALLEARDVLRAQVRALGIR